MAETILLKTELPLHEPLTIRRPTPDEVDLNLAVAELVIMDDIAASLRTIVHYLHRDAVEKITRGTDR